MSTRCWLGKRRTYICIVGGWYDSNAKGREKVAEIFGQKPHDGINPDEVVAVGAAIQASVLNNEISDVLLMDVTPLTMGIEISGGLMEPIIDRNTTIPCRKSKTFTTAMDNQDMVRDIFSKESVTWRRTTNL